MEKGAPRTASRITTALLPLLPLLFALPSTSASETELWDSGELEQGANWTHTFSMATNDMFYCKPHSPDKGFADFTGWVNVSDDTNASAKDVTIYINDFSYEPRAVLIKPGTSVTWTNNDSAVHTATKMDMDGREEEEDTPGLGLGATATALAATSIVASLRKRGRQR